MKAWNNWFEQRSPREQLGIQWAVGLVLVLCMWQWAISPAWRTFQTSAGQRERLQQQIQQMQALQQQLQALRQQNSVSPAQTLQDLQTMVQALGPSVKFNRQGGRVVLDFKLLSPQAYATLLTQVRSQAHAQIIEAHAQFKPTGWEGQLILALPREP
jgi:general secretion pathway protein M